MAYILSVFFFQSNHILKATAKINNLKDDYAKLDTTDKEKIEKLKKQYYEHKMLWETEKLVLLNSNEMEFSWDQVEYANSIF